MSTLLGKIDEFDGTKEDWPQYVERVDHFFDANGINDAGKKKSTLLAVVGPSTYTLLRNLVSPDKPGDKTYDELVKVLREHYNPTPSETVQRARFNSRSRKPGESVATFVAELRSLAEFCNYGATLEVMLRDRLTCGINSLKIQQKLLAEKTLTLAKAVELAQSMETAAKNAKELAQDGASVSGNVNRVTPPKRGKDTSSFRQRFSGTCYCCGKVGHKRQNCRMKNEICRGCGKKGHLIKVCRSKQPTAGKGKKPVNHLEESGDQSSDDSVIDHDLFTINSPSKSKPYRVNVTINEKPIAMEIDTGASITLVSERTFRDHWPQSKLAPSRITLRSYSGESIPVVGSVDVIVEYDNQSATLPLLVVKGEGPSLLGRNWLGSIKLNWHEIFWLHNASLNQVLEKHKAVFEPGLGKVTGYTAKILVDQGATPKYSKARTVPYFYREKVEKELNKLVEEGTLEPVEHSEWASPIVAVLKPDKESVRICGDFKQSVNPVAKLDRYPIPRVEDLFAKLSGGKNFTKIDLSQAYLQVPLDEESKKLVVINTHKGLYRYTRLPYGVSSAPGIFQRLMENVLQGIPNVIVYIDDILITGATDEEHIENLARVLERLEQAGFRARHSKCKFMAPSVSYLGHMIDEHGLHPLQEKVRAVKDAPSPKNVSELKSYLGILTYYSKFLQNMADVLAPLYKLLRKDVPWQWTEDEQTAFQASKDLLTSSSLLVHFNPDYDLVLMCDASSYGVGAVLAHRMPDGSERPIGYASRSLTAAQRNYSQIEREALALVFGVQRFHSFLFGHRFELVTDHQPLLALLHEHRPTSIQASARIRRWSLLLASYEYTITFRRTQAHQNADALSRLPLSQTQTESSTPPEIVLLMDHLDDSPVTARHIRVWTRRDPILSKVVDFVERGWPGNVDKSLSTYSAKRSELSVYQGCLLWGSRVVIPPQGRNAVLLELHEGHPGMTRMKALGRMYVWWPNVDTEIERSVQECHLCQQQQSVPPISPLQPWKWPSRPWTRLHMDFAGPFEGKMILVVIDSHSKWIEAFPTEGSTSSKVIDLSRTLFSQFGLPEILVTDNGPGFVSEEFETFLSRNGIKHITSAPFHPATNGLAERAVQIVKKGLKKEKGGSMASRLAKVLIAYRTTPQSTTGVSPSELLQGRRIRTRLDLIKPNVVERVEKRQAQQKLSHDGSSRVNTFEKGETVYAQNFGTGSKWIPAVVQEVTGPVSFLVKLEDGRLVRRHLDHLRRRDGSTGALLPENSSSTQPEADVLPEILFDPSSATEDQENNGSSNGNSEPPPRVDPNNRAVAANRPVATKSYPQRDRRPPNWYHNE